MNVECTIEGKIAIVTINKPSSLNALNSEVLDELSFCINSLELNRDVSVIIFTGTGKAFVAGADISEMADMNTQEAKAYADKGADLFKKIEELGKITIAAVNGFALGGGCELAMSCDIRIASEHAKFGQPEVGLGIIPGFSGIRRMYEILGEAKAKEYIFTGKMFDAREAEKNGLINKVVNHDSLMAECKKMAFEITSKSFNAVLTSKKVINALKGEIGEKITQQSDSFAECFVHPDQRIGMIAFLTKQKPTFI